MKRGSAITTSPWRTLSRSAPTKRSTNGASAPVSIENVSPTAACSAYCSEVASAIAGTAPSSNVRSSSRHGLARSASVFGERRGEREAVGLDEARRRRDDRRVGRPIEVQAAGVLSAAQAEARDGRVAPARDHRPAARPGRRASRDRAASAARIAQSTRSRRCRSVDRTTDRRRRGGTRRSRR